jgi:hypothetical protein
VQSTGQAASIDQKISGVSRLLNAKFLLALWQRGCHFSVLRIRPHDGEA